MNAAGSNLQLTTITSVGVSQPINRFTPLVSLNYLLYNFGGREAQLESAQRSLEASNWTHDATLQTVMFAAIQAYYQVFATQAAAEAALVSEQAGDEALSAAQKRYEVRECAGA
jgi:outer membrane protein